MTYQQDNHSLFNQARQTFDGWTDPETGLQVLKIVPTNDNLVDDEGNPVIATQLLQPRVSTRPAKTTPLLPDEGLGDDPPLSAPQSLAYWGRGIGGDWQLTIPQDQFDSGLNLAGLTQVQVWIGYQFIR